MYSAIRGKTSPQGGTIHSDKTNMSINWTHRSSSTAHTSVLSTSNGFSKSPTSRTRRSSRTSTTCTTPTTPCPFAAARPTSSSLKKQRHPHKLIDDNHVSIMAKVHVYEQLVPQSETHMQLLLLLAMESTWHCMRDP